MPVRCPSAVAFHLPIVKPDPHGFAFFGGDEVMLRSRCQTTTHATAVTDRCVVIAVAASWASRPSREFGEPRAVRPRVLDFEEETRGLTAHGSPRTSHSWPCELYTARGPQRH